MWYISSIATSDAMCIFFNSRCGGTCSQKAQLKRQMDSKWISPYWSVLHFWNLLVKLFSASNLEEKKCLFNMYLYQGKKLRKINQVRHNYIAFFLKFEMNLICSSGQTPNPKTESPEFIPLKWLLQINRVVGTSKTLY